jgi:hypothetical protein
VRAHSQHRARPSRRGTRRHQRVKPETPVSGKRLVANGRKKCTHPKDSGHVCFDIVQRSERDTRVLACHCDEQTTHLTKQLHNTINSKRKGTIQSHNPKTVHAKGSPNHHCHAEGGGGGGGEGRGWDTSFMMATTSGLVCILSVALFLTTCYITNKRLGQSEPE